jgi:hypothetical protein
MKKIIQNTLILFTIVLLSSCLKDDTIIGPDSPNSAGAIIEFENPDYIAANTLTATVKLARYVVTVTKGTASQLNLRVNYSGTGKGAPSDVTVGVGIDAAALTLHNTQAGRTAANQFNLIPATWYNMPTTVVIPAGKTGVDFTVPINTTNYVAGTFYALPLKITSASQGTISGNFGTIIVNVVAP